MIKKIIDIFEKIEDIVYKICLIFSKGFFFYFYLLTDLLYKIIPLSFFKKLKEFFKEKQTDTVAFLFVVLLFFVGVFIDVYFYPNDDIKHIDNSIINGNVSYKKTSINKHDLNLYRSYSKMDINSVSLADLRKDNDEIVSWLMVDGTSINYPIVKGNDNDYYLNHNIMKDVKSSGWTFMDYRNSIDLSDDNTIFYGHNLINKTGFGSLINLFEKKWYDESNHYVVVLNDKGKYIYEVFSVYTIEPELYYLQNNFTNKNDYLEFLTTLKNRSIFNFNLNLNSKDKIITLSTCTDDNKERRVVHAKLIKK
ncbi:MAG: class B sortase [Bacilli bacterium]|nr:class B sortase [Bacilli bacterium]